MMVAKTTIHIVGGGLAGAEAAWQILKLNSRVVLHEMRPSKSTPAHKTGYLAELVCSNSLKSQNPDSAPGQLKFEMQKLDSLILKAAHAAQVPAGQALAVDREKFSRHVSEKLAADNNFARIEHEVTELPAPESLALSNECWIISTGPLTTSSLMTSLSDLCQEYGALYFYDAISPIIAADSIDYEHCFFQGRYNKDVDYLNIPLDKDQYDTFIADITAAEKCNLHEFEDTSYFEACLPIEVMIERGHDTLRFGPCKPVGLTDPKTPRRPYAVIQLRKENIEATMYSMVGFQTKMKWPEQKRVFSKLPALKHAEFYRYGSIHRNCYLNSPKVLNENFSFKNNDRLFLAGQITGVEGYLESAAIGLLVGRAAVFKLLNKPFRLPPRSTMLGSLAHYVLKGGLGKFQPMNTNMGLLPPVERTSQISKQQFRQMQLARAQRDFVNFI